MIKLGTGAPCNAVMLQVTEYVKERIAALRTDHPGQYANISCLRTNAQKYLPYYFNKGQLTKLFFLFPVRQDCKRGWSPWTVCNCHHLMQP